MLGSVPVGRAMPSKRRMECPARGCGPATDVRPPWLRDPAGKATFGLKPRLPVGLCGGHGALFQRRPRAHLCYIEGG